MPVMTPEQFQAVVSRQQAITKSIGTAAPPNPTAYVSSVSKKYNSGGGSSPTPAPVKTVERLEEEYQPIESMTPAEAKVQGYEYSGAAGWHRPKPTIKNIEMLRARAMQQREELSHMQNVEQRSAPDPGRAYYIGDNQVSRAKYLNTLAVAQIEGSTYLDKLGKVEAQIHGEERLRRTNLSQSHLQHTKNTNAPVSNSSLSNTHHMPDNRPEILKKVESVQERQERLSWLGKKSLAASLYLLRKTDNLAERGTSRVTNPHVKNVVTGFYRMGGGIVAGIAGTPAFVEGMVRKPSDAVILAEYGARGIGTQIKQEPVKFVELTIGGLIAGNLVGRAVGHVAPTPKYKITGVKSAGHEVFSVTSKTGKGKGTMYSHKSQYDVVRQADSIMARMLHHKPKTEVLRVATDTVGKFKKGKTFDLESSMRSGQENIAFANIKGKYTIKTLDKAGAKTHIKGVSREHGTLRHNTEMDIYPGKVGSNAVKISAKGTKHTVSTKILYSKFTRHQVAGKASIVDEATRAVFHSMDDSLSAGLARGHIRARIIDTGKVKLARTEGMISRVHTGGSIPGGQPVVRHAPKPAPTGQPMKSMDVHLPTTRPGHTIQAMTQRVKQGSQAVIHKAEVMQQASMKATIQYAMRHRPAVNTANMGRISSRILSMDSIILSALDPKRRQDRIMPQPVPVAQTMGQPQERERRNTIGRPQMLATIPSMDFLVRQGRTPARLPGQAQFPRQGQQPYQESLPRQTTQPPQIRLPPMVIPIIPQFTRPNRIRIRLPLVHSNRMQLGGINDALNTAQKSIHHQMMSAKRFMQSL